MYTSPYETTKQRNEALVVLQKEYEVEVEENARAAAMELPIPFPEPELKVRKVDSKGGIDWFIYRERILSPLLYPFTQEAIEEFPNRNIIITEDNAPAHIHHYNNIPRERLAYRKLVWLANSPDLNPLETIWTELKDKLRDQIGPRMSVREIRRLLEQVYFLFSPIFTNIPLFGTAKPCRICLTQ